MEITKKSLNQLRLQNIIFIVLLTAIIGLIAFISNRYNFESDWTANNRNTLSDGTIQLLEKIPQPVKIISFLPKSKLLANRKYIIEFVAKYQKYKKDITLEFIDPNTAPDKVRKMNITTYGEMVVEYQGRNEHITQLKEQTLSNTLQRLLRQGKRKLLFITGHGERKPYGRANFNWSDFASKLKIKGFNSEEINLGATPYIPKVAALIIANPQVALLPGEVKIILDYVKQGGNLLWLQEPGESLFGLQPLADLLGVKFLPGTIVDPTAKMMNVDDPTFSLVTRYPTHPITQNFQYMSIFPRAVGIKDKEDNKQWESKAFLKTANNSWSETGPVKGVIDYNHGKDIPGPLTIGMTLTRKQDKDKDEKKNKLEKILSKQRIVILGDGDFLSNAYLSNQGNLNLGHNIINWISHDDNFISIPTSDAPDSQINIGEIMGAIIALMFLILLPLGLLASGILIWLKRRKR